MLAGANVGSEGDHVIWNPGVGGTAAGNYTLAGASGSVNITVSAVALTVTNLPALDKIYDGTTMPRWMRPMPGWRACWTAMT